MLPESVYGKASVPFLFTSALNNGGVSAQQDKI